MILWARLFLFLLLSLGCSASFAQSPLKLRNTFIGGTYQNFTGERENSLAGSEGYGLTVISTPYAGHFRLIYGATLSLVDGRGYIASTRYSMTGYSADAIFGVSIYPIVNKVAVRPLLELSGLGGFKYMEVTSPPVGIESRSSGLTYGYRISIGLETNYSYQYGLRVTADYVKNSSSMFEASPYGYDHFGFTLGFYF